MNGMMRNTVVALLALGSAQTPLAAQNRDRKFEVGIRSALIVGTMQLSRLDPAFEDLGPDGLTGPHMSGFFFLYRVRPHVRVGIETLVANSDQQPAMTMNYQAAGPVVELSYGDAWFISGGVHAGGLIVNAMTRQDSASSTGASPGVFYKANGGFVAPYADIGRRFGRAQLSVFVKSVNVFGPSKQGRLSDFSSSFVGLRLGIGL